MPYKIKKEFTPMDFYDYVKSCGREKCLEFKSDFHQWTREVGVFCLYRHGLEQTELDKMLERANFRKYMIEGGFIEEEKPKQVICTMEDMGDSYHIMIRGAESFEWSLGKIFKDGHGMKLSVNIDDPNIQTDSEGRIKII